jgi:membrane protease YdiL (CAAX protease family)
MSNIKEKNHLEPSDNNDKQPSIIGTIGIAIIMLIMLGFITLILVIPMLINGILTLEMFELPQNEFIESIGMTGMALLTFAELLAMLICLKFFLVQDNIAFKALGFQLTGYKKDALIGAIAGIAVMASSFYLLFCTHYIDFSVQAFSQVPWLSSIALFLFVAFNEEILFRGYIQNRLMRATGPYKALAVSSLIFMTAHLFNDNWTLVSLLNLFLAGVSMGLYYLHTRNLWFPIAIHFTWNFFQGTVFGFEVSGAKMESWITITRANNPLITGGEFGLEGSILITAFEVLTIILIHLRFTMKKSETAVSRPTDFKIKELN